MLQSKVATNQGCESRGLALPVRVCNTHKHAKPDSTRASGGGVWCQLKPSFAPVTNSPQSQGLALPEVSSHSCCMSADPRRPTSWSRPIRDTAGHPGCLLSLHSPHGTPPSWGSSWCPGIRTPLCPKVTKTFWKTPPFLFTMWLGAGLKTLGSRSWLRLPARQFFLGHTCPLHPASGNMAVVAAYFETD